MSTEPERDVSGPLVGPVMVLGLGVEGQAAARFLKSVGTEAILVDQDPAAAEKTGMPLLREEEAMAALRRTAAVWRSPGIAPGHPLLSAAARAGLTVTTPTGHWLGAHAPKGTITITGTKGKSTTATILSLLLNAMEIQAEAFGNIGRPPLDQALPDVDTPVVEMSSYMAHDVPPGPYRHIVLNLYREHIPWHGSFDTYRDAKLRPFLLTPPCSGITTHALHEAAGLGADVQSFEALVPLKDGVITLGGAIPLAPLNPLFGSQPMQLAVRAAAAAALWHGDAPSVAAALEQAFAGFQGLPSRQEIVPSTDGRVWINDALGTVPEAVLAALASVGDKPVTLLLGGIDRDQDLVALTEMLADRTGKGKQISLIIFGGIAPRLGQRLAAAAVAYRQADGFTAAIGEASQVTAKDGIILFSPGAASDPEDGNFAKRAAIFREAAAAA